MRILFPVLLLIVCCFSRLNAQKSNTNSSFASPLKPPYLFSGDFGELRPSHFHSGLDYRTQGKTGLPVFAVKDGYISRVGISATGYGNALYMNHPDGTTSLYAHLQRFNPELQEYVKEKQYESESFQININLPSGRFNFKKGETIAWSGNSGSSGGPHLHFEIRDTKTERAHNPIFYNLGIKDNSAPKIKALYVYPLSDNSYIGKDRIKKRFEVVPVPGGYRLHTNQAIELSGKIGFGIQADDDFGGVGLKCGIYSAVIFCDGNQLFGFKMDNFSFADSRYANAQADYEEYLVSKRWIQRLYKQPGNHLDIYEPADKNGTVNFLPGKGHEFEIVVSDAFKNKATLRFHTTSKKTQLPVNTPTIGEKFLFDQANSFENEHIKVKIPRGALYDNIHFIWKSSLKTTGCYSPIHQVHSKFVALHLPYSLSIKCDDLPEKFHKKALIAAVDPASGRMSAIGGEYSGGWVTVKTNLFGRFAVTVDKTPPVITPLKISDKKKNSISSKIQFKITDDLSGIKSYRGEIDGNWVLFEFDAKTSILSYTFDKNRIVFGKSHLIRLLVVDYKDNSTEYKAVINK